MSKIEIDIPARLHDEVERLVDSDEFLNREQAIEELLKQGVSVYDTGGTTDDRDDQVFTQTQTDQRDPAARDQPEDDGYTF